MVSVTTDHAETPLLKLASASWPLGTEVIVVHRVRSITRDCCQLVLPNMALPCCRATLIGSTCNRSTRTNRPPGRRNATSKWNIIVIVRFWAISGHSGAFKWPLHMTMLSSFRLFSQSVKKSTTKTLNKWIDMVRRHALRCYLTMVGPDWPTFAWGFELLDNIKLLIRNFNKTVLQKY